MKKLLLTGAEGFTGKHFKFFANTAGYLVEPLVSDLTDSAAVFAEVCHIQPHYVVHLAGLSSVTHSDYEAFYRVNLFGTLNLLDALCNLSRKPDMVLLASSANVYGSIEDSRISEAVPPKPISHYAMSKLAMEIMSNTFSDKLPMIIVRPFNYTGISQDTRFVIPKIIDHFKRREPEIELGNLNVLREYNDVRIVCQAYLSLLKLGTRGEIYNICSGKAVSIQAIISILEELTGHSMIVKVNSAYVRANEINVLSGSPEKIEALLGPLAHPTIQETLTWMLDK